MDGVRLAHSATDVSHVVRCVVALRDAINGPIEVDAAWTGAQVAAMMQDSRCAVFVSSGGFIAGLIVAIAFVMQYMASGFAWASARQRLPYHTVIGGGVLIAALTGMGSWLGDVPFLTSAFGYVKLPGFEKFELATAALFDLGVFLAVSGAIMLALESFARFAWQPDIEADYPMDINPERDEQLANEGEA